MTAAKQTRASASAPVARPTSRSVLAGASADMDTARTAPAQRRTASPALPKEGAVSPSRAASIGSLSVRLISGLISRATPIVERPEAREHGESRPADDTARG